MSDLTASEALYEFMGWLTTREEIAGPFSSKSYSGQAAGLVDEFCKMKKLAPPREGWGKALTMFWCEEMADCGVVIAVDDDHAKRLLIEHYPDRCKDEKELTLLPMDGTDTLPGWSRWDQDKQEHVYIMPTPTVDDILKDATAGVCPGDVEDAIVPDGTTPEEFEAELARDAAACSESTTEAGA